MKDLLLYGMRGPGRQAPLWCLATLYLAGGSIAAADVVVIEPVKDNTLFSTTTTSNGAGDAVLSGRVGPSGGSTIQRAVLAFDIVDAIPSGSTIVSANLTMTLVQVSPFGGPESHTLHRVLADWGEGASISFGGTGALAQPGDATWLHTFFPDQFWASAGGDFVAAISASQTVGTAFGQYTWGSTPIMVADVQGWLDAPSTSFGWLVMGNEIDDRTSKKFASKDSPDGPARPKLSIEYLPPPCPWDCALPSDGEVNVVDFLALLAQWGQVGVSCDFDGGGVSITEFLAMLANWGPCP
ncbi:MAG: DNRLRE domain-containing protein [Planctomycetota bacterium]|jgi:hypothetical protein